MNRKAPHSPILSLEDLAAAGIRPGDVPAALDELQRVNLIKVRRTHGSITVTLIDPHSMQPLRFTERG